MIIESAIILVIALIMSLLILGLERKIQARIQQRYGPPLTTPGLWSALKFMHKENVRPDSPNPAMYHLFLLAGLAATALILLFTTPPWYGFLGFASLLGIAGLLKVEEATYLFMGSFSRSVMSESMPYPDILKGAKEEGVRSFFEDVAAVRSLKMITLGSFPYYVALILPFAAAGSMDVATVLSGKPAIFTITGAFMAFIYFMGFNIIANNRPFDIIKPKVDIMEGPWMEYAATWRALTYVMKGFVMFTLSSVFVTLYLGVPLDVNNANTAAVHLALALVMPILAAILKAYSPVLTFKQIYPISYKLTVAGLVALAVNVMGVL
ncbi:MAG: NADH-quinone oxidoreductase subunit H [Candidatus Altiarchaeota archaeon]